MTDAEILELIRGDAELVALAKAGDDESLAKTLVARLPPVASEALLRPSDFLRLFGWTRGLEILDALPGSLVALLGTEGLPASDESAAYWSSLNKAGIVTADEAAAIVGIGQKSAIVTVDDVSRILRPVRADGKADPTKPLEVVEAVKVEDA